MNALETRLSNKPVKIIAELGINHCGDLGTLRQMIKSAAECGVDYVKIQKRDIGSCYSEEELSQPCKSPWGKTVRDKVCGRELSWDGVKQLDLWCKEDGVEWFASCFDPKSLKLLHDYFPDRPLNKVPSAMALSTPFMEMVASQNIKTLVSTGLCKDYDHIGLMSWLFSKAGCKHVLNHCVALYPCPPERLNLLTILELRRRFVSYANHCMEIGYSGHETGILPSVIAAQLGATYIERHFTLDRSMYGADQAASLEPEGMKRMVRDIRSLPYICGGNEKKLVGDEKIPVKPRT